MKYMMLIADAEDGMPKSTEEEQATYGRIGEWWNEHTAAGRIIEGHELQPSSTATALALASSWPGGATTLEIRPIVERDATS
jgi:hypothetical protein